jgi:hypothetical protein
MDAEGAWIALIDAAKEKDLDTFRVCLKAYARATMDEFSLPAVEQALREDNLAIFLIAKQQEIGPSMTIIDLIGNPDCKFVLSIQLSAKPRRAKMNQGWPENPAQNLERLASCGYVQDRGVPLCGNCGELGHVRKHCKQEQAERKKTAPEVQCVYCQEIGHRARDCHKERINPYACRNCKQEGHTSKECPEPRSAEGVECRKCNETGHFSKDVSVMSLQISLGLTNTQQCPNVAARTCRNCDSTEHMAKDCDQPKNPDKALCRNCEKMGHFSRDCPEPRDYSKVKCNNCQEMGHTVKVSLIAPCHKVSQANLNSAASSLSLRTVELLEVAGAMTLQAATLALLLEAMLRGVVLAVTLVAAAAGRQPHGLVDARLRSG